MKKTKILIISVCSLSLVVMPTVFAITFALKTKAETNNTYQLVFSKDSNHHDYEYALKSSSITAKNYLDEDITFKYNRMMTYDSGFAVMKPGSEFYNPFIASFSNYNALDGLMSVKVTYNESTYGDLYLYYGIDELYTNKKVLLENGKTYSFDKSYRPSHFKLVASPDEVLDKYQLLVSSIEFTYSSYEYYTEGEEEYNTYTLKDNCGKALIASNEEYSFNMGNYDISSNNFLIMKYHANGYLKGKINYFKSNTATPYSEEFFINPDEEEFRTFLDYYRRGAGGYFGKTITSISFSNPNDNPVTIYLKKVLYADRTYSRTDVKSITDGNIKVDISLKYGGSISGIYDLSHSTIEYYNDDGEIKIRSKNDIKETIRNTIATNPNLINCYDLGREIQQSYYFDVYEENGYTRGRYLGNDAQYNPVQAGDNSKCESKIIDYFATDTKIWIKVQATDWAKENSLSKSYMTNTYEIKDKLLYVNNTFINWYNFTNYKNNLPSGNYGPAGDKKYWAAQELPAIYVNHPLNYYSSVLEDREIYDKNQGWNNKESTRIEFVEDGNLKLNSDGKTYSSGKTANSYHYEFRNHPENWLGYLNEDKFGLAVYMPAQKYHTDSHLRHVYVSANNKNDHSYNIDSNRNYLNDNYENVNVDLMTFMNNPTPSYKVSNTNYLCTVLGFYPSEFVKIDWTYAVGVDYIDSLKTKFKAIQDNELIYNDFTAWKGAGI